MCNYHITMTIIQPTGYLLGNGYDFLQDEG